MIVTLRIQKRFFDEIAAGRKNIEYRAMRPYYSAFGSGEVRTLIFHYQGTQRLVCEVKKVVVRKKPSDWDDCPWLDTPRMYCIYLGARRLLE